MLSSPLGPNPSVDCLTLTDRSLLPQTVHQGPEKGRKKGGETGGRGGGGFELGHFPVTGTWPSGSCPLPGSHTVPPFCYAGC